MKLKLLKDWISLYLEWDNEWVKHDGYLYTNLWLFPEHFQFHFTFWKFTFELNFFWKSKS
jgi:hypothetical protein